jgi:hypothetical protein
MNPVPIVPARLDWPSAIGNFLLNFGTLDWHVFGFLKDHLAPEEFAKVREWHFKDRVGRITQLLQQPGFTAEQQNAFAQMLTRMEQVRELRNHIAHGHMHMQFDPKIMQAKVTVFKAKDLDMDSWPDAKHVEFSELLEAMKTLSELIEEFDRLSGFQGEWHDLG